MPALTYLFANRMRGLTEGECVDAACLCEGHADVAQPLLTKAMASADDAESRTAYRIAIDCQPKGIEAQIAVGLKRPAVEDLAARLAANYKLPDSVPDLMLLAGSPNPKTAAAATDALSHQESSAAISTATVLLGSPYRIVREAAIRYLAKYPKDAEQAVKSLFTHSEETPKRTGIRLLATIDSMASLAEIVPFLGDVNPGVKIEAMLALNGQCPKASRATLMDLRRDPDQRVRAVALGIDPGR